jgi:hypothetical protein
MDVVLLPSTLWCFISSIIPFLDIVTPVLFRPIYSLIFRNLGKLALGERDILTRITRPLCCKVGLSEGLLGSYMCFSAGGLTKSAGSLPPPDLVGTDSPVPQVVILNWNKEGGNRVSNYHHYTSLPEVQNIRYTIYC